MLFSLRLPVGQKTVPYSNLPMLIAEAKHGPREALEGAALELFGADWARDESELESAVKRGEIELVDSSFYPLHPPFTFGQLQRAAVMVDTLPRYLERINGMLVLGDEPPLTSAAQVTATPAPLKTATGAPPLKQPSQEARILELLKAQGYDPINLAQRMPGKPGPKTEIRTLALTEPKLFTKGSFDKAWERLRSGGDVAGAE